MTFKVGSTTRLAPTRIDRPSIAGRAELHPHLQNGVPSSSSEEQPDQSSSPVNYFGAYVQDDWTIARRLTLTGSPLRAATTGSCRSSARGVAASAGVVFPASAFRHPVQDLEPRLAPATSHMT